MRALFVQQGLTKTLMEKEKLHATMKEDGREELDLKTLNTIKLYLTGEV